MALHRDIYWVGRQWAVTGFGVQAVDQRLKGTFDIEVAHLWDDDLPKRMRALAWLKADDFDKALDIARARHPEPPRKSLPLVESILEMIPAAGRSEVSKPPISPIEASPPAVDPPKVAAASIKTSAPPAAPASPASPTKAAPLPAAPAKPAVAPMAPNVPASKPLPRMVMGSKPAPPPAPPSQPPVARPVEAGENVSKSLKRLVGVIEPALAPATPPKPAAAPVETAASVSKPVIEQSPAKFQPLALKIEHASAKFLPRWRVRHG
jgi:hypothetical protein